MLIDELLIITLDLFFGSEDRSFNLLVSAPMLNTLLKLRTINDRKKT
jgi:hypothetical protein